MNRNDFQQLADVRIEEAAVLLAQGKYDGAYYLAGYAVECRLKPCIAKLSNQYDFPPKPRFINDCYSHDIDKLVNTARLAIQLNADAASDPVLKTNWAFVKDWTEQSRYDRKTQTEAQQLFAAITDAAHGVLPWIRQHW